MYTDKPQSLSVKNFLIRKMSTAMNIPEKTITTVIDHQFVTLIENMSSCNSLEISGFGKFMFHKNKAPNMMIHYLRDREAINNSLPDLDPQTRKRVEIRLSNLELKIKALHRKLQSYENQFCTDLGGVEKPIDPLSRDEGAHTGSSV